MAKIIRIVLSISFTLLIMGNSNYLISLDDKLNEFGWKKRIVLLITGDKDIKLLNGVNSFFKEEICQNNSRNIELFRIIGNEVSKYKIPERYKGKKGIWLIGYDGGDKAYSQDISLLSQLHDIVDKMPMRQNEMLTKEYNCD